MEAIDILVAVLGLALIDSLNPSAIAVTILLVLSGRDVVRRVLVYVSAVFLFYLVAGLLLVTGATAALRQAGDVVNDPGIYVAQGVVGALMLLYGIFAPSTSKRPPRQREPRAPGLAPVFLLGLTVSLVEFATALPYLAAISLIAQMELAPAQFIPLLLVYNAIFVLPPLGLLALGRLADARVRDRFERWRLSLTRHSRTAFLTLLAIVGFVLLADALLFFDAFGIQDVIQQTSLPHR